MMTTTNGNHANLNDRIKGLEEAGSFLADRLDDFERLIACEADGREFYGHVSPALARFRAALSQHKAESR